MDGYLYGYVVPPKEKDGGVYEQECNLCRPGWDDTQYHGAAFDKQTGKAVSFKCRPTLKGLVRQLEKLVAYFTDCSLVLCYEASYIGHCLQRDLTSAGYRCDVIAPGSIPRKGGSKSVKTDRIDALDLAQFHANDLLTGSEFINQEVVGYCQKGDITFTRSRTYKKNDQAYVEEKNGSVVRRMIGYDRYEGREAWQTLGELYRQLRLYVNYSHPSLKLLEKKRNGSHVSRRYEVAKTAYQRVLQSDIEKSIKCKLTLQYEKLDAVDLLCRIQSLQARLRSQAVAVSSIPAREDAIGKIQHFSRQGKKDGRKGPHHWRTRKDLFVDVKDLIEGLLTEDPHRPAASVLRELIERNPDRFRQGHTRSIQRRVNEWRENNADKMATLDHVMLVSEECI